LLISPADTHTQHCAVTGCALGLLNVPARAVQMSIGQAAVPARIVRNWSDP